MALITSPRLKFDLSLIAIVVLAIAIRLTDLSIESHFPQPDEGFALDAVMQPTIAATIRFVAADTHPPFYFLVLRIWLTILPSTMFFAKLLSVIFNVANIALTYGLARLWVDRRTARLAALVMMLSPWNIYWSHLARNHQMLPLLFTLSCWSLLNWLRSGRKEFPVWYCLWATLMLQTNYLSFFVLATQGVVAVWECRREIRRSMGVGIAAVIAIAFYAPFAGVLLQQVRQGPMNAGFFQHTVSTGYLFFHFVFFNIFTYRLGALWYPPPSSWASY